MQLGAEPSPDCGTHGQVQCGGCFVCALVGVFREVYRVLRDDGTVWLNLGDTYASGIVGRNDVDRKYPGQRNDPDCSLRANNQGRLSNLPSGNLVGVPWRVAMALQADGWVLRQDVIWYASNKMPESVTNRCTKSHEHIFLLAKGEGYYYDATAIEEDTVTKAHAPGNKKLDASRNDHDQMGTVWGANGSKNKRDVWTVPDEAPLRDWLRDNHPELVEQFLKEGAGKRDVWAVPTQGYPGAHFACYSPRLIAPCILAGTSEYGCCAACGRPWERVVAKERADSRVSGGGNCFGKQNTTVEHGGVKGTAPGQNPHSDVRPGARGQDPKDNYRQVVGSDTVGWRKACACRTDDVVPAVVLDPFVGSGTTVSTALDLGRAGVGIDLSETYLRENAIPRVEAALAGGKVARRALSPAPVGEPPARRKMRGT